MSLVRWRPARNILSIQDEINRMFGDFLGDVRGEDGAMMSLPLDIIEKNDKFVVAADLPGLKKEDIRITLQNNLLTISGTKSKKSESKDDAHYMMERSFGSLCRTVNLPPSIDHSGIEAEFVDGVLSVMLPKKEDAKPKEIRVGIK